MRRLYSFFKVIFFAIICYMVMLIAAFPFILIPDNYYPYTLSLILIKESSFLISGVIIIISAIYYSVYTKINFRLFKTVLYYLSTLFIIVIFGCILYLLGVIDVNFYSVTSFSSFGKFLIYCTIPTIFIGFGEEFIFRWFLFNRLKTFLNTKTAIVLSAFIFCLGHKWILPNLLFAFTGGCLFSLIYSRTNSIFSCISIHAAWNFGQRFFFSGMSFLPYKAQRVVLFNIKNLDLYNWMEFSFCALVFSLFVLFYKLKDKNYLN